LVQRGISPNAVMSALSGGLGGVVSSNDFRETDRRTPIAVRYAGAANENFETALATMINGIPVGQLVRWQQVQAPQEVVRINQRPVSIIEALIDEGGTARASADVAERLEQLDAPAGIQWTLSGADLE